MDISEKDFATQVEALLDLFGWTWVHFRPARTKYGWTTAMSGKKGFPDYVAAREIHPEEFQRIFFELKNEDGIVSPEQELWLKLLNGFVFRPSQIEEIAKILR